MKQKQQLQIVSKKKSPMKPVDTGATIGIDLGDQWSHYCVLNEGGEIVEEGRFRTTPEALTKHFDGLERARIAMEAGTHLIWINEKLRAFGHEVIVANVQELHAICRSNRKCDRADAEKLARHARLDPEVLRPIKHRSVAQQEALTLIRARDVMVRVPYHAVERVTRPGEAVRVPVAVPVDEKGGQALPGGVARKPTPCFGPDGGADPTVERSDPRV